MTHEPFVTTEEAARFLAVKPRTIAALARKGLIPAHQGLLHVPRLLPPWPLSVLAN